MNAHERKSFVDLPNEIIAHIATYLDNDDIIDCMCVSSSWNACFRTFRLLAVNLIRKSDATSFLDTLSKQFVPKTKRRKLDTMKRVDSLGQYVHKLRLEDGLMTIGNMQKLAAMCPNVTTVRFDWYDGVKPPKESTKSTRRFRSPVPFFEHFHPATLTCLDLDGEFAPSTSVNCSWDTVLDVLWRLPQLLSLTVTFDRFFPTLVYMEELHRLCPELTHLKIGWANWRYDDTSIPQSRIKQLQPSVTMRSLAFPRAMSADWRMQSTPWYQYITHKYPSLTSLEIFPVVEYKGYLRNASRADETLQLRSIWPNLVTLNFDVFTGHPCTALPLLVKGIPNITLRCDVTAHFSQWIKSDATNDITQLSISTLPSALYDLSCCPHLRELCLGNDNPYIGQKIYQELPLDVVLSSCPALEKLSVFKCYIRYSGEHGNTSRSLPLKTLELSKCTFADEYILRHIGERCPSITHLDLELCSWINTDQYPVIKIPFPQNWFMYFRLVAPTVSSSAAPANFAAPRLFRSLAGGETRQTRWVVDQWDDQKSNECLMLKTPEHNESDLPLLFWVGPRRTHPEATISRIFDADITQWLRLRVDGLDDDALWLRANEGMESMRVHHSDLEATRGWSTVLCCRGVDRFYYHAGRVNLRDRDFISTDKRYKSVVL